MKKTTLCGICMKPFKGIKFCSTKCAYESIKLKAELRKYMKTQNKTVAIVTVNELGDFTKKGAKDVSKWLRQCADNIENDYKLWTNKKAVFKYITEK